MISEPTELWQFVLDRFQAADPGAPGEEPRPAALDEMDAELDDDTQRMAARRGIESFLRFARQFMVEHPPQTHVMLAQGFGVQLAGGYEVCLVPPTAELEGTMEEAHAYPVTEGRSIRGQGGVQSTAAYAITGTKSEPSLRNPGR